MASIFEKSIPRKRRQLSNGTYSTGQKQQNEQNLNFEQNEQNLNFEQNEQKEVSAANASAHAEIGLENLYLSFPTKPSGTSIVNLLSKRTRPLTASNKKRLAPPTKMVFEYNNFREIIRNPEQYRTGTIVMFIPDNQEGQESYVLTENENENGKRFKLLQIPTDPNNFEGGKRSNRHRKNKKRTRKNIKK